MTGRVRRARRSGTWLAALMLLLVGAVACTDDGDSSPESQDEPGSTASDPADEAIHTTVEGVIGKLARDRRADLKAGVNAAVDGWFEGAFLGDFPRADYAPAFDGFTEGAREDALGDLALLSNKEIEARIENAEAGNRRVRLEVLAPRGEPQGVTAHFVLDFFTYGELEDHRRVRGSLYLTPQEGTWRIFGYDVIGAQNR